MNDNICVHDGNECGDVEETEDGIFYLMGWVLAYCLIDLMLTFFRALAVTMGVVGWMVILSKIIW